MGGNELCGHAAMFASFGCYYHCCLVAITHTQ